MGREPVFLSSPGPDVTPSNGEEFYAIAAQRFLGKLVIITILI
jgi:hypothetical protein